MNCRGRKVHQFQNNNVIDHERCEDTAILYCQLPEIRARLDLFGLSVKVDVGLNDWRDLISEEPSKYDVTGALSPHYNELWPGILICQYRCGSDSRSATRLRLHLRLRN